MDVDDIIASATLREETATICVAGGLNAEHEAAEAELRRLDEWSPHKLGDEDPRKEIAERIAAIEERMRERQFTFRFRALPWAKYKALIEAHPAGDKNDGWKWNPDTFPAALMLACSVDPVFRDVAHVQSLFEKLTQNQVDTLVVAAISANEGRADVPKSVRASALMASSAPR